MNSVKIVNGDVLDHPIIAHQCNSISTRGAGLYSIIANEFSDADIYKSDKKRELGSIIVTEIGDITVIAIIAQRYPGRPNTTNDTKQQRIEWFRQALVRIKNLKIQCIAFPYGIGCGLARGSWSDYLQLITNFANCSDIEVSIVKKY